VRNETLHYSYYLRDVIAKHGRDIVTATIERKDVVRRLAAAYFERCSIREHVVKRVRKCHGHFLKKPEKVIHTVHGLVTLRSIHIHASAYLLK